MSDRKLCKPERSSSPSRCGYRVLSSHGSRAIRSLLAPSEKNVALWIHPARSGIFCTALYPRVGRAAV